MSFQAVEIVLKQSKQKGAAKLALVCIAYHANKDTGLAWPSLETLAEYCNCTDRYVRDILAKLAEDGELEIGYKQGPNGTNLYKILLSEPAIDPEPEFRVSGHNTTADPELEFQVSEDKIEATRNYSSATPGTIVHNTRNYSSPEPKEPKRNLNKETAAAVATDAFEIYQNEIGALTQISRDQVIDYCEEYSEDWFIKAVGIAVGANARNLRYIHGILKSWKAQGGPQHDGPRTNGANYGQGRNHQSQPKPTEPEAGTWAARRAAKLKAAASG